MTNSVVSHSRMTDAELRELYATQLATGKPVVTHISEPIDGSDGNSYVHLYIAQERSDLAGATTKEDALFLGWTAPIIRTHRNAKTQIVESMGMKIGATLSNAKIVVKDDHEPEVYNDGREQEPRLYGDNGPNAGQPILHNGQPVYRHTQLVVGRDVKDVILTPDTVEAEAVVDTDDGDFDDFAV